MTLKDWIATHKPFKNQVERSANGYKVKSVIKGEAKYDQLFRLSDYSAVAGSKSSVAFLIKKER
jgi:hypothetical protein